MNCRYAVVGPDDTQNFGLAQTLRRLRGREFVARFLDVDHVEPYVQKFACQQLIIFLDLFGFELGTATNFIGRMRDLYPRAVFCLFVDKLEFSGAGTIPASWRSRLQHYYKLYKENDADLEFEPIVRAVLQQTEWEADYNTSQNEPIRLTPVFERGLSNAPNEGIVRKDKPITFVSYARQDWDMFVSRLVTKLSKEMHPIWVDQEYLVGGDDWMDAIGEALRVCERLLLVLSPASITSKYVKMEYRYFFKCEKTIIPLLYQTIEDVPFELAPLQFLDFTATDTSRSYLQLLQLLSRRNTQRG